MKLEQMLKLELSELEPHSSLAIYSIVDCMIREKDEQLERYRGRLAAYEDEPEDERLKGIVDKVFYRFWRGHKEVALIHKNGKFMTCVGGQIEAKTQKQGVEVLGVYQNTDGVELMIIEDVESLLAGG